MIRTESELMDLEERIAAAIFDYEATDIDTGDPRPFDEEDCKALSELIVRRIMRLTAPPNGD